MCIKPSGQQWRSITINLYTLEQSKPFKKLQYSGGQVLDYYSQIYNSSKVHERIRIGQSNEDLLIYQV